MSVRRTVAALLASGLLLAGCGDDPEPRFEPTPEPTSSESTASAEPEAQTPEEFVEEWVSTYNAFEASGDSTKLRAVSRGCGTCAEIIDVVSSAYENGGYLRSDGWRIADDMTTIYKRSQAVGLRTKVKVSPSSYRENGSSKVVRAPGSTIVMEFDLEKAGNSWLMFDLTRQT